MFQQFLLNHQRASATASEQSLTCGVPETHIGCPCTSLLKIAAADKCLVSVAIHSFDPVHVALVAAESAPSLRAFVDVERSAAAHLLLRGLGARVPEQVLDRADVALV